MSGKCEIGNNVQSLTELCGLITRICKESQAWCNLKVKLRDPCLSALRLNAV